LVHAGEPSRACALRVTV